MSTVNLRGGLSNNKDNEAVLEETRKKLIAKKEIDLQKLLKKPSEKRTEGQRMSIEELANYVNNIANGDFEFIFEVAMPFLRQLDKDVAEIGSEVKFDLCEDGNETRQQRADEYEATIPVLTDYVPENDRVLREEAENPGRRQFVEALCLRVRTRARIGLLADDIHNAEDKDCLERLLEEAKDDIGKKVFVRSSAKDAPIRAFGKGYELTKDVFGEQHHDFASKKLAEVVNAQAKELATAHNAELKEQTKEVSAKDGDVSPDELLSDGADGKESYLPWFFQGKENGIRLRRSGPRLYVLGANGTPVFSTLEAMRKEHKEPFITMRHIFTGDGKHLCLGVLKPNGRPEYKFSEIIAGSAFQMTCWVRTAAGANCPDRLLQEDETRAMFATEVANGKKPFVKPIGELLTDKEFLYFHGMGEYDLVFETEFHYELKNEESESTGATFDITERAVARIERKQTEGKFKLALKSASSEELLCLLKAGGALVGHEFFEGAKGAGLPIPLFLGIGQAFKRLKLSE